jgi:hypothetical protein
MAFDPKSASLKDLTGWIGNASIDSINYNIGMAEIVRRQTDAQIKSSDHQILAAKAGIKAADAAVVAANAAVEGIAVAQRNAKYMLASVIVAATAAIFSAISAVATLYSVVPHK